MQEIDKITNKIENLNSLLDRKILNLNEMLNITKIQNILFKEVHKNDTKTLEYSSKNKKQAIIDEILSIDDMFLTISRSFAGSLNKNKQVFKDSIKVMQDKIQIITGLDAQIRLQEEKNNQILKNNQIYNINKSKKR